VLRDVDDGGVPPLRRRLGFPNDRPARPELAAHQHDGVCAEGIDQPCRNSPQGAAKPGVPLHG
jgi:hypothetical protein